MYTYVQYGIYLFITITRNKTTNNVAADTNSSEANSGSWTKLKLDQNVSSQHGCGTFDRCLIFLPASAIKKKLSSVVSFFNFRNHFAVLTIFVLTKSPSSRSKKTKYKIKMTDVQTGESVSQTLELNK